MRVALTLASVIALICACATAPQPATAWRGCGDHLECATVTVPVDWARPDGPTLELAVARYPAAHHRQGPVFFNPGGPGLSGVDALRERGAQLSALVGGRFDIVSWDVRGSGGSSPISCADGESTPLDYGTGPLPADFAARCGAFHGELLAHLSTAATARDLDRLRVLSGESRVSFYGEGYGSFLGQTYANLFPQRVRAMVLDGIVDPVAYTAGAEERVANTLADAARVFDEFARLCREAHGCPLEDANETLAGVLEAVTSTPLGLLTYEAALVALHSYLGTPARWPEMAAALAAAADGDGSALAQQARRLRPGLAASIPPAAGIGCADSPAQVSRSTSPARLSLFTAMSPVDGPLATWWSWMPCASWPVHGAEVYTGPWSTRTETPILVIGTTADPVTPYRNARTVSALLGNAVLLTHTGYGHPSAADPSDCTTAAVREYLVLLRAPRDGTVCPSNHQPFDPDFGR